MAITSDGVTLDITPLTGTIGAEVAGIDLGVPQSDATMRAIERAMHKHSVLFFRDQNLDDTSHRRFGAWFGDLDVHHSRRTLHDYPEIYVLEGYCSDIPWHADNTYKERPARASILRAVSLPQVGGDTIWTSTCVAYDTLSSSMQIFLDGLHAQHDSSPLNMRDPDLEILKVIHPVIIDHPYTGERSIFVNPMFTRKIVELSDRESRHVLSLLYEHIQQPSHQVRLRWQPGTVAMWDNFSTQHFVVVDYAGQRTMHRVTIQGQRPTSSRVADLVEAPAA